MLTEDQVNMWLVYCGLIAGAFFGFIMGRQAEEDFFPGCAGFAGGCVWGAIVTAIFGFILGFIVKFYDVPGNPGFVQAVGLGLLALFIGGVSGAVGGIMGGILSVFLRGKKR